MILHLFEPDKFTLPLVALFKTEVRFKNHYFLSLSLIKLEKSQRLFYLKSPSYKHIIFNSIRFIRLASKATKIVVHGTTMFHYLFIYRFFLKKVVWVIYGYEIAIISSRKGIYSFVVRSVLKNVNAHFTHIKGDSEIVNFLLNSNSRFIYSPMYLSNVVETDNFITADYSGKQKCVVLVGNSTDPSNNHLRIFDILASQMDKIDKIFCPLSYGTYSKYRDSVIREGRNKFGDKFVALLEFLTMDQYSEILKTVDVAVFNHERQQAMGVTLTLLSLGKVVYLNENTTSFKSLKERGFKIFANSLIEKFGILYPKDVEVNKELLQKYYSKDILIDSYLNLE